MRAYTSLLSVVLVAAACVSVRMRGGQSDPDQLGSDRTGRAVGPAVVAINPRASGSSVRRVCRLGGTPRGWIAIGYVAADTTECPKAAAELDPYPIAILARYDSLMVGARLTVCADQRVPRGWTREPVVEAGEQCPTGNDAARSEPLVMLIRRIE